MKNVLIIASFWPYRQGSKRVIGLVNHLPKYGWQPIVLTPPLETKPELPIDVIETPVSFKTNASARQQLQRFGIPDKLLTYAGSIINYPDAYKGWRECAVTTGADILNHQKIDAILSIWPVTTHLVAKELKARFGVPWVADFPDLWSQNAFYVYGSIRRGFDRRLEIKTIESANALTTTSEPWAEKLRALHRKPVYSITHGFDAELMDSIHTQLTKKFTITHTGMIYSGKRDPTNLIMALAYLFAKGKLNPKDVDVSFYGAKEPSLDKLIEKYKLSHVVRQFGSIPLSESLRRQKESQVLLLLDWDDDREQGVYTGKVFEYLGARRPILATGGSKNNVIDELLRTTGAGIHATDLWDTIKAIEVLYQDYKKHGAVTYLGDESKIKLYSHEVMARRFAEVLDGCI